MNLGLKGLMCNAKPRIVIFFVKIFSLTIYSKSLTKQPHVLDIVNSH